MNKLQKVAKGLEILSRYPEGDICLVACDQIWAGPEPGATVQVSKEDHKKLLALDWFRGETMYSIFV